MCLAAMLGACTTVDADPASAQAQAQVPVGQLRVLCVTVGDRLPDDRLAVDLARSSGLGVVNVRALSARTFAVQLQCASAEACEQGLARLQAARHLLTDVSVEGRRTIPRGPAKEQP